MIAITPSAGLLARFLRRKPVSGGHIELVKALHTHAGLMFSTAARILGGLDEAQDVVQDVSERLLKAPPQKVQHWPALLKTMATNRSLDLLRGRRDWRDSAPPEPARTPDQVATSAERANALRKAIGQLSERDAALFSLYYLAEVSQTEIGRQLSLTPNAVGVALHRVRKRLAAAVEKEITAFTGEAK